ncbi:hypothetical protein EJ04DRAFT_496499 [Polyplosphaeria fusca]|uniref:LysM domain-containing protein n=1 Tax=Polyplosphaeria fusca TaxID=682080 RepID=A0A9P4V1U4_9PLEO|nr:hypothetical protein EJ04DRAFT_496499 [Polyplosphaeria fusca]
MNCSAVSAQYNVATGTLRDLNKALTRDCGQVQNGTLCLPAPCQVAMQWYDGGIEPFQLMAADGPYPNMSFTQFMRWNTAASHSRIWPGDYICTGPPGGAYVAALVPGSTGGKPVYTTTATPAKETPPGTIKNCGHYYDTISGDYCQMIAMNFSITFDQLRTMNPQLDTDCLNLWANASYCVATVRGSTLTPITLSSTSMKPSSTSVKPSSTSTAKVTAAPPAPTQSGASKACYEWYTAADGDYCYLVYTKFGITFDQLRAWNTALDSDCTNMWPGYAYCVKA